MVSEEDFLKMAKAKYFAINTLTKEPTLLDYERGLAEVLDELGRELLEGHLKGSGKDRRKKKYINPPSAKSK